MERKEFLRKLDTIDEAGTFEGMLSPYERASCLMRSVVIPESW
jgi:hypothetical protein